MSADAATESGTRPRIIAIIGPTAAGKTDLSFRVHEKFGLDVISMDSAQVYRRMNIGTAKPDQEILDSIPHHLIDIREPSEHYTAADFVADANRLVLSQHQSGRPAMLVGGTMMYFRSLVDGLSPLPEADPAIRQRLAQEADAEGWASLHRRLSALDPAAAVRINPNDPQRIQRALEVIEISGRSMTDLHQTRVVPELDVLRITLTPTDRSTLHRRIEQRFAQMLDEGLIAEVESLLNEAGVTPQSPSMRSVGYRQVCEYLYGKYDRHELLDRGIFATRQLAKRQLTWLRKETNAHVFDPADDYQMDQAMALMQAHLQAQ